MATGTDTASILSALTNLMSQGGTGTGSTGGRKANEPMKNEVLDAALGSKDTDPALRKLTLSDTVNVLLDDAMMIFFILACNIFEYAGFNPEKFHKVLLGHAAVAKISVTQFAIDMALLIGYYMKRGTTINKRGQENTDNDDAKSIIDNLCKVYRIQDGVEAANSRASNVVTIARISATYVEVVAMNFHKGIAEPIGKKGTIPAGLMFAAAASLIPTGSEWDGLFSKLLDYLVQFDEIVNRVQRKTTKRKFDPNASRDTVQQYAEIARTNGRLSNPERIFYMSMLLENWDNGPKISVTTSNQTGEADMKGYTWDNFKMNKDKEDNRRSNYRTKNGGLFTKAESIDALSLRNELNTGLGVTGQKNRIADHVRYSADTSSNTLKRDLINDTTDITSRLAKDK